MDAGPAVLLEGDVEKTSEGLGKDARAYRRLMAPLVSRWEQIIQEFMGPFPFPPRYPLADLLFGLQAIWSAATFARCRFSGERSRALFAGLAAHAIQPLEWPAATVHIGGTFEEIAASERAVWEGNVSATPFLILAQASLFDPSRAPAGKQTAWVYCHVPNGSTRDMTTSIERQIERFAPGFHDQFLQRHVMNTRDIEYYNPNYIGGDINGGVQDIRQLFTRPVARLVLYSTPNENIFICSSSTPPGGGVHGMCGFHAAMAVLRRVDPAFARSKPNSLVT